MDILLSLEPNLLPATTLINLVLWFKLPIKICVLEERRGVWLKDEGGGKTKASGCLHYFSKLSTPYRQGPSRLWTQNHNPKTKKNSVRPYKVFICSWIYSYLSFYIIYEIMCFMNRLGNISLHIQSWLLIYPCWRCWAEKWKHFVLCVSVIYSVLC